MRMFKFVLIAIVVSYLEALFRALYPKIRVE